MILKKKLKTENEKKREKLIKNNEYYIDGLIDNDKRIESMKNMNDESDDENEYNEKTSKEGYVGERKTKSGKKRKNILGRSVQGIRKGKKGMRENDIEDVYNPESKGSLAMQLVKAIFLPFIIIFLACSVSLLFKFYKPKSVVPAQNLGRTPYTRSGSSAEAPFTSHEKFGFPYDLKGSHASAKGIIRETTKQMWYQTRFIMDMLIGVFKSMFYSESMNQPLFEMEKGNERKEVSWPYIKGSKEKGYLKGAVAISAEGLFNYLRAHLLLASIAFIGALGFYIMPTLVVILAAWQQIDVCHTPVLPIPQFILSLVPPGFPVPRNPLMIHIMTMWGWDPTLQIIGFIIYFGISIGIIFPLIQFMTIAIPVYMIYFFILRPFMNKKIQTASYGWFRYYLKRYYMLLLFGLAIGVSSVLSGHFQGDGPISKFIKNKTIKSLIAWMPAILVGIVFFCWLMGWSPKKLNWKERVTLLKPTDKVSVENDKLIRELFVHKNKGGWLQSAFDMLKPLKEGVRTPLQWLLKLMKNIYLFLGGKPLDHS
tara:strand:- start:766 stop:2379 length:1614 start_codon:yes stop_codon:yes gene_type:complete